MQRRHHATEQEGRLAGARRSHEGDQAGTRGHLLVEALEDLGDVALPPEEPVGVLLREAAKAAIRVRGRLRRVLENLLANALKFSPGGGDVRVTLERSDGPEGSRAVISVQDQGIGVPAGEVERIFEPAFRASNVSSEMEGFGLGLAGAKQIVERHGGRITLQSRENVGTSVAIDLPV